MQTLIGLHPSALCSVPIHCKQELVRGVQFDHRFPIQAPFLGFAHPGKRQNHILYNTKPSLDLSCPSNSRNKGSSQRTNNHMYYNATWIDTTETVDSLLQHQDVPGKRAHPRSNIGNSAWSRDSGLHSESVLARRAGLPPAFEGENEVLRRGLGNGLRCGAVVQMWWKDTVFGDLEGHVH